MQITRQFRRVAATAVAAVVAVTLAACGSSAVQTVDAEAFSKQVTAAGVVVIDVRTPGEYASGHIQGAINIDYEGDFAAGIADLDKTKTYAIYCYSGTRSGAAAQIMADAGFTTIYNLKGGTTYWQAAGYPLVA